MQTTQAQAAPARFPQPSSSASAAHTPGPWNIVKSFNGFVITRTWSSGFYQRMRTQHLRTHAHAVSVLASMGAAA